mmetsp:Transcript_74817/g.173348  ORF Transcript_74817/g.173348 Transcript_74817/m.173348 type:complete len:224 (+) Transcript_74817:350-1021(+)
MATRFSSSCVSIEADVETSEGPCSNASRSSSSWTSAMHRTVSLMCSAPMMTRVSFPCSADLRAKCAMSWWRSLPSSGKSGHKQFCGRSESLTGLPRDNLRSSKVFARVSMAATNACLSSSIPKRLTSRSNDVTWRRSPKQISAPLRRAARTATASADQPRLNSAVATPSTARANPLPFSAAWYGKTPPGSTSSSPTSKLSMRTTAGRKSSISLKTSSPPSALA